MLYLDMDGVVADFDGGLAARGILPRDDYWMARPREHWSAEEIDHDTRVTAAMDDDKFWLGLKHYPGAREFLHDAIKLWPAKVKFLTALPRKESRAGPVRLIKKLWLWEHLGVYPRDVITCVRSEKQCYAQTGGVLVDDMTKNCAEFEKAGGLYVCHKDFLTTIKALKEIAHV